MPMAWAENGTETVTEPANPAADKAVTLTQGDTVQQFDTLQAAIDAVQAYDYSTNKESYEITLNQNLTESVEIPAQRLKLTIDLNGCKLTNSDHHTITNKSTYGITITDSQGGGIVDNVSHGKAAIYNDINAKNHFVRRYFICALPKPVQETAPLAATLTMSSRISVL